MVVDFHSHSLFKFDDGPTDMNMAAHMQFESRRQGVDAVVFTSHCYPVSARDVDKFLERRQKQYAHFEVMEFENAPQFYPHGCEVHLTGDISQIPNIRKLCIEDTSYMLLEMPMKLWSDETIENVYKLTVMGIRPIIAHDERNMHQRPQHRNALHDLDVLVQINAPSLMMKEYRRELDRLFEIGMAHVIGSDMHNITTRPQCMQKAGEIIGRRYGAECWEYLHDNATRILAGETISYREFRCFKKRGLFSK